MVLTIAFFYELDRNVELVDDFFTKKSTDMQRRLKLLIDKYGDSRSDQLDYHELEDLVQKSDCGANYRSVRSWILDHKCRNFLYPSSTLWVDYSGTPT